MFEQRNQAVSLATLLEQLKSDMNKTSVYRILERLEYDGTLHSFIGKDGAKWFSKYNDCSSLRHKGIHQHFHCNDCGKTECLTVDATVPTVKNYKIETASVLLTGSCCECTS